MFGWPALQGEQSDVVVGWPIANERIGDAPADRFGVLRRHLRAKSFEAPVEWLAAPFDQTVGVEDQDAVGRHLDSRRARSGAGRDSKERRRCDVEKPRGLARYGQHWWWVAVSITVAPLVSGFLLGVIVNRPNDAGNQHASCRIDNVDVHGLQPVVHCRHPALL
jgi:hypothetical protein